MLCLPLRRDETNADNDCGGIFSETDRNRKSITIHKTNLWMEEKKKGAGRRIPVADTKGNESRTEQSRAEQTRVSSESKCFDPTVLRYY